jgi:hypothetical protein
LVAATTRTLTCVVAVVRADRLDFARLEEAQEQRLHPQAHLADLVEEERAAIGELELARLVAIRAGEAAPRVAEQLRLEERLGEAGAVDGDERAAGAPRADVDQPRDEILAHAALARDEHFRVTGRGAASHGQNFEHERAAGDNLRHAPWNYPVRPEYRAVH